MRNLVFLAIIYLFIVTLVSGCAAPGSTADEVSRRHSRANNIELQQMQDDMDKFWMTDRPSRLSDKYVR